MKRAIFLGIAALLCSCRGEQPSKSVAKDPIHRVEYALEHISGPALSQAQDRIYAETGSKRELIFEGHGATHITIKPLREGIVLIGYCGGSIKQVNGFLANRTDSENALAVKVQPIVIPNVEISGNRWCPQ